MSEERTTQIGRRQLVKARRVIVKVGSHALAENEELIPILAEEISSLAADGRSFVLVSSGAVALGWGVLGYRERPREIARLQAAAAAGQSLLMGRYREAFSRHNRTVAQVLMTHLDLSKRQSLNNARGALGELLEAGVIPIVNENDTVSTAEIRFSDNDQLTSMVAPLIAADLVVLLTNVEGVLDADGNRISVFDDGEAVHEHDSLVAIHGTGGISGKVTAARKACRCGAHAVVAQAGSPGILRRILAGEDVGTLFQPSGNAMRARKHWIAYTLRPRGTVVVDQGAEGALRTGSKSLLPIGVIGVRGKFDPGDAVRIVGLSGREIARGLSRLSAQEIARTSGICRDSSGLGDEQNERAWVVVHKDDLVLMES